MYVMYISVNLFASGETIAGENGRIDDDAEAGIHERMAVENWDD
jgi:hypothetical protein